MNKDVIKSYKKENIRFLVKKYKYVKNKLKVVNSGLEHDFTPIQINNWKIMKKQLKKILIEKNIQKNKK